MTWRSTRAELLARLRQGPLAGHDYAEFATSRASLKVRIRKLRLAGFTIASDPLPDQPRTRGRRAVAYRLIAEPAQ